MKKNIFLIYHFKARNQNILKSIFFIYHLKIANLWIWYIIFTCKWLIEYYCKWKMMVLQDVCMHFIFFLQWIRFTANEAFANLKQTFLSLHFLRGFLEFVYNAKKLICFANCNMLRCLKSTLCAYTEVRWFHFNTKLSCKSYHVYKVLFKKMIRLTFNAL